MNKNQRTNIWAPKGIPNGVCCKIPYKGFEISIAMDDSCGRMKNWERTDIRIFNADPENISFGVDVSREFFVGEETMLYGDAETLIRIFKKIDEIRGEGEEKGDDGLWTVYWKKGVREVLEGDTIEDALLQSGYENGSISDVAFYYNGEDSDAHFFGEDKQWHSRAVIVPQDEPEPKEWTIYWRDGKRSVHEGSTIEDAFTKAGYGAGAKGAVDFYFPEDNDAYKWNSTTREWELKVPMQVPGFELINKTTTNNEKE